MKLLLRVWLVCALAALAAPALGHDLQYSVTGGQAVVVRLFYVDNKPFSFESYSITREGDALPWQTGRTDRQGRIAFLPDRAATWRIKAVSEDGHGADFSLATDAAARIADSDKPAYERYGRIVAGIALILGLFGALTLFARRKNP